MAKTTGATKEGVHAQQMNMKSVFSMEGGQGESSYVKNCHAQSRTLQSMLPLLEETLDAVRLPHPAEKLFTAADLGCSCGHNTFVVADAIVQHMTKIYTSQGHAGTPEFCVYFSDLPSNDFNTLFQLLQKSTHDEVKLKDGGRRYFAAGVPGSFHDRLFPERSIDVFSSTFCLHWLSQVPREVVAKKSAAYNNNGRVFVHGGSEAAGLAYKHQFQSDLARFLQFRAVELKHGGAMFLVCLGRTSAEPTDQGNVDLLFGAFFQDSWDDLVHEGIIDRETRDSFNVPVYAPTLEEFQEVVEANDSFHINSLKLVKGDSTFPDHHADPTAIGQSAANTIRSLVGALVDMHIGKPLGEKLFDRLQRRAEERAEELIEEMQFLHVVCSLSLHE